MAADDVVAGLVAQLEQARTAAECAADLDAMRANTRKKALICAARSAMKRWTGSEPTSGYVRAAADAIETARSRQGSSPPARRGGSKAISPSSVKRPQGVSGSSNRSSVQSDSQAFACLRSAAASNSAEAAARASRVEALLASNARSGGAGSASSPASVRSDGRSSPARHRASPRAAQDSPVSSVAAHAPVEGGPSSASTPLPPGPELMEHLKGEALRSNLITLARFMELCERPDVGADIRTAQKQSVALQREDALLIVGAVAPDVLLVHPGIEQAARDILSVYGADAGAAFTDRRGAPTDLTCLQAAAAAAVLGNTSLLPKSSPTRNTRSRSRTPAAAAASSSEALPSAAGSDSDSDEGAPGAGAWGGILHSLTSGGRLGLRGPVTALAESVWKTRKNKDHFTGASRDRVEGSVGGIEGAPQVDHIVEVSLLESILMNAAVTAVGDAEWAGGVLDEWESEQLLQRLRSGEPLLSGQRRLRSSVPHHGLAFAATNDSAYGGDGWAAGQGNLNVTHRLANLTKKGMFRRYKLDVLSLHPNCEAREVSDSAAAGLSIVSQWDNIVDTTQSDLPAYLRAAGLRPRDVTRAVRVCIRDATDGLATRLAAMYDRAGVDAADSGHATDIALLEAIQRELLHFRRLGGL